MKLTDIRLRLRALFYGRRVEQDLDDELDFHLAMQRRKHVDAGETPADAARLARRDFGSVALAREDCREARGLGLIDSALQDVRYAFRTFGRAPGFALAVTATIALGLGLNAALFTLFNAYVLRPLAVRDPYALYVVARGSAQGRPSRFSWTDYQEFARTNPAFPESAAIESVYTRVDGHAFQGELVSGRYFQMLGVRPELGRLLLPEDALTPGSEPVLVLSYSAWQRLFSGRPDMVGQEIRLRGCPMRIVGVAQRSFAGVTETSLHDFWAPLTMSSRLDDGGGVFASGNSRALTIVGRLAPGENEAQALAKLDRWVKRDGLPSARAQHSTAVQLISAATAIPLTPDLLLLITPLAAAFGLVLLLACGNVANMMLARAISRQSEIGVRLSLGAGRARIIRQLLTESILLSLPAAALASVIAWGTIQVALRAIVAITPPDLLELFHMPDLSVDWRVCAFMLAAAVVSAFLFGLAPAIQVTRGSIIQAARGEFTQDVRPMRARNFLVASQVALCTLLMVACGALLRTTFDLSSLDIGFRTHGLIALKASGPARARVLDDLARTPAVDSIAAASAVPLGGLPPRTSLSAGSGPEIASFANDVSPLFFSTLGIPILEGRAFTDSDSEAPVAILSRSAARVLFPGRDAVGETIHSSGGARTRLRVVGIVPDIVTASVAFGKDYAMVYRPAPLSPDKMLIVSVRGEVESVRRQLDVRFASTAPGAIDDMHSLDQYQAAGIFPLQVAARIAGALGLLALLLTVSGAYGVLSYLVTQRTKEIGIRMALGAPAARVVNLIFRQTLRVTAAGLAVGLPLAIALVRIISSRVVFLRRFDALSVAAAVSLVIAATLSAAWIPSRRAARIDPARTLRGE